MLTVTIPSAELFNQKTNEFIEVKGQTITLEHSLVSISKWESKWNKPFLSREKSNEELLDYIRCMTLTQNVNPDLYRVIPNEVLLEVNNYINLPMTATTFTKRPENPTRKEIITAEIIYYWMIAQNIPFECQKWHINRLLTLIKVCSIKNQPNKKKMSKSDILSRNQSLNAARRAAMNSKG